MAEPLLLKGAPGSPYTRKMLAYMRYRHIPYRLMIGDQGDQEGRALPQPKVSLLPTFYPIVLESWKRWLIPPTHPSV